MTIWHSLGETDSGPFPGGTARWKVFRCTAMTERHTEAAGGDGAGTPGICVLTGFLFPVRGQNMPAALRAGRDFLAAGDWSGTPEEAEAAGAEVFRVRDAARPARFSGGRLTDWCHFRAYRTDGGRV